MKIIRLVLKSGLSRVVPLALAVMGLSSTAAMANSPEVVLKVAGEFGNGKSIALSSGKWIIAPSKKYDFELVGTCVGTGQLAAIVPPGTPIGTLLEQIGIGSSSALIGYRENPDKKLPLPIFDKVIKGSRTVPGVGKITFSMKVFAEINASQQVVCKISNVVLKTPAGKVKGTIKFLQGAKLTVTTAAEIQFKTIGQKVGESAGFVNIVVWRFGNTKQAVTAQYKTVADTATSPDDFTYTEGTVAFGKGKKETVIKIPITKNPQKDPYRKFAVELVNPEKPIKGVVLGDRTKTTIGISGDPS